MYQRRRACRSASERLTLRLPMNTGEELRPMTNLTPTFRLSLVERCTILWFGVLFLGHASTMPLNCPATRKAVVSLFHLTSSAGTRSVPLIFPFCPNQTDFDHLLMLVVALSYLRAFQIKIYAWNAHAHSWPTAFDKADEGGLLLNLHHSARLWLEPERCHTALRFR